MMTTGCTRLAFQLGLIFVAFRGSSVSAILADERTYVLENGVEVPRVGFGTAGLGDKSFKSIKKAIEVGFRHIDTARATEWYDEESVGRVLEAVFEEGDLMREDIFITTKIHPRDFGYNQTRAAFEDSLVKLKTNYVDMVLLHAPGCWEGMCEPDLERGTYQDAWRALEDLYSENQIRAIGVSNFNLELLTKLAEESDFEIHNVQNWMDPLHQDSEVRQWCEENGVMYTSYSTLGTQHRGDKNPVLTHPVIVSIAKAHKVSPAVVVLSWALELGVGVIPRSSNPKHIKELATVLGEDEDDFGLPLPTLLNEEEVEKITAIGAGEGKEKRVSDEL